MKNTTTEATLYTSTEAARILGASRTSIKRWADEGLLKCVKTAGKHRRFRPEDLERFQRERMGGAPLELDVPAWLGDLVAGKSNRVMSRLYAARAGVASWAAVGDLLGAVLAGLGQAWRRGDISVAQEHLASRRLASDLECLTQTIPLRDTAPRAILLTPAQEAHTLGLSLVSLALRERGWRSIWIGARTPLDGLGAVIDELNAELVAVSASLAASDEVLLAAQAVRLGIVCEPRRVSLLLGGSGAWPDAPSYGFRLKTLGQLAEILPLG